MGATKRVTELLVGGVLVYLGFASCSGDSGGTNLFGGGDAAVTEPVPDAVAAPDKTECPEPECPACDSPDGASTQCEVCEECPEPKKCEVCEKCEVCQKPIECPTHHCENGTQDEDEVQVDCGGSCGPCDIPPSCNDGIRTGNETSIDCGGDCSPCIDGSACNYGADCLSFICDRSIAALPFLGLCAEDSCADGIRNGTETDVDCGGGECPDCADGKNCYWGTDCLGNNCNAQLFPYPKLGTCSG